MCEYVTLVHCTGARLLLEMVDTNGCLLSLDLRGTHLSGATAQELQVLLNVNMGCFMKCFILFCSHAHTHTHVHACRSF
jgi:hypothetical protein